jgi:hypothetical protein
VDFETTTIASDEREWANDIYRKFSYIHIQGLRGLYKVVSDLSTLILVDRLDREYNIYTLAKQLRVVNH